jgi:hypothetical protein
MRVITPLIVSVLHFGRSQAAARIPCKLCALRNWIKAHGRNGAADKIPPAVIAKLIEFRMVELSATGLSQLTAYGENCYAVVESGDGVCRN